MYIYIDFYKQFQCIGSSCQNSCCNGWGISLDPETAQYYENVSGEFGDFLRQNIHWNESKNLAFVNLTAEQKCPFLDKDGLCRVYLECGEEHMSDICKVFPRSKLDLSGNSMRGFSMSCEEVLRILHDKTSPVHLCVEGTTDIKSMDDLTFYELSQFIEWGMELLQNENIPFYAGLATVVAIGLDAEKTFRDQDYESFESVILRSDHVLQQFMQAKKDQTPEMEQFAWNFIFGVTDTFCHLLNDSNSYEKEILLWKQEIFHMNDQQRRSHLLECWNNRNDHPEHLLFLRRLAAAFFHSHAMRLVCDTSDSIFLRDLSNYMILAKIIPLIWGSCPHTNDPAYFSGLSHLAHHFEQSSLIREYIWPVILDLFHPDLYTYAMAFMVLFGE